MRRPTSPAKTEVRSLRRNIAPVGGRARRTVVDRISVGPVKHTPIVFGVTELRASESRLAYRRRGSQWPMTTGSLVRRAHSAATTVFLMANRARRTDLRTGPLCTEGRVCTSRGSPLTGRGRSRSRAPGSSLRSTIGARSWRGDPAADDDPGSVGGGRSDGPYSPIYGGIGMRIESLDELVDRNQSDCRRLRSSAPLRVERAGPRLGGDCRSAAATLPLTPGARLRTSRRPDRGHRDRALRRGPARPDRWTVIVVPRCAGRGTRDGDDVAVLSPSCQAGGVLQVQLFQRPGKRGFFPSTWASWRAPRRGPAWK